MCVLCVIYVSPRLFLHKFQDDEDEGPSPKLCILRQWPDFQGYGFNLHAEMDRPGQLFIGQIDPGSPAEAAALREGDRLIEINDENVQQETLAQVVPRIKAKPDSVSLLVIEPSGEEFYKQRGITINKHMRNVVVHEAVRENGVQDTGESSVVACNLLFHKS